MPAPTALLQPATDAPVASVPISESENDADLLLLESAADKALINQHDDVASSRENGAQEDAMVIDEEGRPQFAPATDTESLPRRQSRTVPIPPHRITPLKREWPKIYPPLVEHLKLQVRVKRRAVDLRTSKWTTDTGALQKGADFIRAFALGFRVDDAIALLRLDDLYIESFEIKDVRTLGGDHLARAIGRIAGKDGKTKFAIENTSRTRIALADSKIHILGGFDNIKIARESIVSLILGKTPGKVYGGLRTVAARMKERF